MSVIHVLSSDTIDQIAAGEVVERPESIVKELVENAIDSGAKAITVEIKQGGIDFIRVTDNGCGIAAEDLPKAFLRHATSKIKDAKDLSAILSLGFRGEALSSIAAVAQVELISKTASSLIGFSYTISGGVEEDLKEIGAPDGTTVIVRNIFFNTPVRKKFLKQPTTEAGYISDLMEHMSLSRPDISFKYVVNGQLKFHTNGNGELKDVIYRIFGRDVVNSMMPVCFETDNMTIKGYAGKPILNRSNRNFEIYFINGRFVKSKVIAKAIEDGYEHYLMQHKYPFVVLHIDVDTFMVDVNVHPTKMEVRFSDNTCFGEAIKESVRQTIAVRDMIPQLKPEIEKKEISPQYIVEEKSRVPEPFESKRIEVSTVAEKPVYQAEINKMQEIPQKHVLFTDTEDFVFEDGLQNEIRVAEEEHSLSQPIVQDSFQMDLFEDKLLDNKNRSRHKILGQIFDTYWLITYEDKLFIVDQHAAHEKVKFEQFYKHVSEKEVESQNLNPPVILNLTNREIQVLEENLGVFEQLGFTLEDFGLGGYALRSVPLDLYGMNEKEFFTEILDELVEEVKGKRPRIMWDKLASMACKAAVKGNNRLSYAEMDALMDQLMALENPYTCPHGRPTIISMSKYEIEKKFNRIV